MAKRLIVCCDGTWDLADRSGRTNVTKIALSVRPWAAGIEQRVHYHPGVGTRRLERLRGGAFGKGLSRTVLDAYGRLVDAYEPGDELYLFGFSRGAFTVRSLAGLVGNSGIVRREHADRTGQAWALYRDRIEQPTGTASTLFRRAYAHDAAIHFLGVWDTVGALGIPVPGPRWLAPAVTRVNRRWAFHDTELGGRVKGAFQALAIDEQRSAFRPTLWRQRTGAAAAGQELKQVWFAGVHRDVGGGYPDTALADITLLWMVAQARRYGLEFDADVLGAEGPPVMTPERSTEFRVRPDSRGELHDSRTGLYRLSRPWHRPIGHGTGGGERDGREPDGGEPFDTRELLARTAWEHYDGDASYRPPELERRLARGHVDVEPVPLARPDTPPAGPSVPRVGTGRPRVR
ncbi:DUF2235 domain-containing protein [Streptomyces sp. NPDC085946]|uniref:DUF2235 domain-containing protein n=1 Tax=Streptomyces sp. NPDC085946 TaxID=3365744 RepID=UPI0037D8425C